MKQQWPVFNLRITTPRLVLRVANEEETWELTELIDESVVADSTDFPFASAWPLLPSPDRERSAYQFYTSTRAQWQPQNWILLLTAFVDGKPIGLQSIAATNFGKLRSVSTGSWLGAEWQNNGYGTEMRAGTLELAFGGLDALEAHSAYRDGNERSRGVSRKLGYVPNGHERVMFGSEAATNFRVIVTPDRWLEHQTPGITVEGLDDCVDFFGGNGETWQRV